jgi:hypothetical protein
MGAKSLDLDSTLLVEWLRVRKLRWDVLCRYPSIRIVEEREARGERAALAGIGERTAESVIVAGRRTKGSQTRSASSIRLSTCDKAPKIRAAIGKDETFLVFQLTGAHGVFRGRASVHLDSYW